MDTNTPDNGAYASHQHSFYWRSEAGRANGFPGKRVVSAACPCGWVHMTAYPLLQRRSRVRYLRYRWMEHTTRDKTDYGADGQ